MALLFIRVLDAQSWSCDEGTDYDRPELAMSAGVESAVAIVADEVRKGQTSSAVEIRIEQGDGKPLLRSVVTLSVFPLPAEAVPNGAAFWSSEDGPE